MSLVKISLGIITHIGVTNHRAVALNQGDFARRRHLAMPGDIFGCQNGRCTAGIQWNEARDAATHPAVYRRAPSKELSSPKCQACCPSLGK